MKIMFKAPTYVAQFRCLGGDCEDTCCQRWDIHFDKTHYELLAEKVSADPGEQALFERNVRRIEEPHASERNYARLEFADSGYCSYLEHDGLCHIQSRFGMGPLSNACAFYPRVLSQRDTTVEIAGSLSCPEMARLCFRAASRLEQQEVNAQILPRPKDYPLSRRIATDADDAYTGGFLQVRETLMALLQGDDYPIETRLYAMASLSQRLSAFYYRGSTVQLSRVENECRRIRGAEVLETLDDFCARYQVDEPVSMVVVQSIFALRLQMAPRERFADLLRGIAAEYDRALGGEGQAPTFAFAPQALWGAYQDRSERINQAFGVLLEDYLSRYALNCLHREWFVSMPDVFSYTQLLIIRLNLLRFLVMSNPQIQQLADAINGAEAHLDEQTHKRIEQEVVYTVYNFARAIDHNSAFLQLLYQAMSEQQMITFDYSLAFIKG